MTDGGRAASIFQWLLVQSHSFFSTGRHMLKRTFDILGALVGLVVLAIPVAILALMVRRNLGAPVLFFQDRPGITGWSQVNGRNAVDWDQRLEMDVWYVDNRSLWLDLRIMAMTVVKVIRRDGISQDGQATMDRFRGSGR